MRIHYPVIILAMVAASSCGGNPPVEPPAGPGQFCGGIAGIACPGRGTCVDDPSDSCDPARGGADCSGVCHCVENVLCVRGTHFDGSAAVCACVPDDGSACGPTSCGEGMVCCNASCGICTPPGYACIQIACN
jgi:hypothetical protein